MARCEHIKKHSGQNWGGIVGDSSKSRCKKKAIHKDEGGRGLCLEHYKKWYKKHYKEEFSPLRVLHMDEEQKILDLVEPVNYGSVFDGENIEVIKIASEEFLCVFRAVSSYIITMGEMPTEHSSYLLHYYIDSIKILDNEDNEVLPTKYFELRLKKASKPEN